MTRAVCAGIARVGTYAANLMEALLETDSGLSLLLVSTSEVHLSSSFFRNERVRTIARPAASRNNFVWTNISLRRAIAQNRIDLFHSPGYTKPLGLTTPPVVTLHDVCYAAAPQWYPYSSGFLRQMWYRKSAVSANAILTVSEFSRWEIIRVYPVPPDKVYAVYPGVDRRIFFQLDTSEPLSGLRARYGLQPDYLLFVGISIREGISGESLTRSIR